MAEGQYKSIHTGAEVDEAVSKVLNGEAGSKDAVLYTAQTLTEEQKAQARENIGANLDYAAYGLPVLKLTGDTTGMSKDNAVTLAYEYGDRSGTCEVKWQGSSSLSYPKKNYTIKFDNAFEASDGWGEQKKYCLKANYIDHSHARNVVSAKLWGQIVKSRGGVTAITYETLEESNEVYSFENGVLTARSINLAGLYYLKDFSVPEGGYTLTCEAFFPEGATNLEVTVRGYRVDTNVQTGYLNKTVSAAGEWVSLEFKTIWAAGSSTLICLQGSVADGVKFRNIQVSDQNSSAVYTFAPSGSELQSLPNGGAIDGFPCVVALNGAFHGLYTFNIPKDGWMFGMGEGTSEAVVCADTHCDATKFKGAALVDGTDFELEYVTDEDNAAWVATSLNTLISAVMNSDGTDLDTTVAEYLDWQSAIDYLIFVALLRGGDMTDKNYLLATFDGVKWFFSAYDLDSTYGLYWNGKAIEPATTGVLISTYAASHKVMELIKTYKTAELKARYAKIREAIMSEDNVALEFLNFVGLIPTAIYDEDVRKWPTIPSTAVSNPAQILNWYRMRVQVIDAEIEAL